MTFPSRFPLPGPPVMRHFLRIPAATIPVSTGTGLRTPGPAQSRPRAARTGFTLVELLVVISIIAILAALTVRVAVGLVNEGREAGTKATISKIQRILDARLQAFQRKYGNNDATTQVRLKRTPEWGLTSVLTIPDSNGNAVPLNENARLIATRKLLYVQHFPQVAWELNYRQHPGMFREPGNPSTAVQPNETTISNAEVLYDLIVNAAPLGDTPIGVDGFSANETADLDNDGRLEFVDAWGQPLRFYRWPVLLFRPDLPASAVLTPYNPASPPPAPRATFAMNLLASYPPDGLNNNQSNQLIRDPQDPLGLMTRVNNLVAGTELMTVLTNGNNWQGDRPFGFAGFHYPQTFHTPMVVSAGADGDFGLQEPRYGGTTSPALDTSSTAFGFLGILSTPTGEGLYDNISSLRIRAGGR